MAADRRRHSNLQCFLTRTTPSVPSHSLPKTCFRDLNSLWHPVIKDRIEYFTLKDLWDQYTEWSVYGAGVPVVLNNGETVVQYYVPYLSAIQIYTSKSPVASRNMLEESESDSCSDDSESEKLSRSWDAVSDDFDQDASPTREHLGHLCFQYIEYGAPYVRLPLADKVAELARTYPGLMTLKSVELSPASWMSVAWYPIYHIPARRNVKDLSACFLTYHTISSAFQDNMVGDMEKDVHFTTENGLELKKWSNCITLSPFGLATYKVQGNIWTNPECADHERIRNLYSAAASWLRQLGVHHHDFDFFTTH
ncbi:uncharacterized protein LOC103716400 [Phoenix dactylifera]|uniref:Uncharacterized protein LOC103716400 n=1 Tax=Phoenix dactylifera TaxID=42345 RepID=A0A8B7CMZ5_PHODC|nr:uncharacterized protein LOC103716400 [Phoenix dactylifera]